MKNKILQEFLDSNIKIISQEKLIKYIEYCLYKNKNKRIKDKDGYNKTSYHHILPKSLFGMYKNLKQNSWNGTYLLYSDHYYAHWLLTEAIDDYGQLNAFCAMHNKDIKLDRISESDLIHPKEFQTKMEERGRKCTEWAKKEIILEDGTVSFNSKEVGKKMSETKNNSKWKETIGKETGRKISESRIRGYEDGTICKLMGKDNPMFGKDHTITTKKLISDANIGKVVSDETKAKISKTKIGIKRTEEDKAKISENRKGKGLGKNNSMTYRIEIFNDKDKLMFVSEGNFKTFCKEKNLPYISFIKNFNKKIYQSKIGPGYAKKNGFEEYIGWKAVK